MVFEDAHWTDPTSLEVFGRVVDRIATRRVLLIVTFRPEFVRPWMGRPHVTALTINRLEQHEVRAVIVATLLGHGRCIITAKRWQMRQARTYLRPCCR